MKALEKDPNRRYETATSFAADIERHLHNEPVEAGPPSAAYRFRKFARRNRTALATAALILFFLVLLGGGVGWAARDQAAREEQLAQENTARQAKVSGQLELILDEVARLERTEKWSEALVSARRAEPALGAGEAPPDIQERARQALADLKLVQQLEDIRAQSGTVWTTAGQAHLAAQADQEYAAAFRQAEIDVDTLPVSEAAHRITARRAIASALLPALDDWLAVRTMDKNVEVRHMDKDEASIRRLIEVLHTADPDPWRASLAGTTLAQADLTNALLYGTFLTNADLTGAEIRGALFSRYYYGDPGGITAAQIYSTASYQDRDLSGIRLGGNNLAGINLVGQNLTNANLNADLTGANLSGADARGASLSPGGPLGGNTSNLIQSDGQISGLDLAAGATLVVRDYDGNPVANPPTGPLPIVVDQHVVMASGGVLQLEFDADKWDSTISFAEGIPVARGGTLELTFASDVNLASQLGRTIDLFDWAGVNPTGTFDVSGPYTWNLSNLYTTGEVTLISAPGALPGDFNHDGAARAPPITSCGGRRTAAIHRATPIGRKSSARTWSPAAARRYPPPNRCRRPCPSRARCCYYALEVWRCCAGGENSLNAENGAILR